MYLNEGCEIDLLVFICKQTLTFAIPNSKVKMSKEGPLLKSHKNGVTTIIMNRPKQLNGWTSEMMLALRDTFAHEAKNPETKVMILSGKDPYYVRQ